VAGAYGWQPYHLHVLIVLKFWSLNLLEPSRPAQVCHGIVVLYFTGLITSVCFACDLGEKKVHLIRGIKCVLYETLLILIFEKCTTVVVSLHQYCAGNCSLCDIGLIYYLFGKLLSPGFVVM
jgi:hypothetical protein